MIRGKWRGDKEDVRQIFRINADMHEKGIGDKGERSDLFFVFELKTKRNK